MGTMNPPGPTAPRLLVKWDKIAPFPINVREIMSNTTLRLVPIVTMAVVGGCSTGPSFEAGPDLAANPNPSVPLAAVVRFEADEPVTTRIDVSDGVNAWTLDYGDSHDPSRGLGVFGMRPDRDHQILVTISNDAGEETSAEPLAFRTPPLPEVGVEFPPVETTVSRPERMEPGVTLFNPRRRRVGAGQEIVNFNAGFGMLMVLDQAGEVTWYYRVDSRISDFEKVANGNLIFVTADFRMIEIDWLGNTVNQWYAANRPEGPAAGIPVDTQTFHHEIDELPNGNIIVLSSEWKEVDNYYTDEYDENAPRQRQKVMGDVIVEFERDTGEVVWEWRAFDHMDPFRIGYETFSNYWIRRGFPDTLDWSHANNLLYDESDDSIIINFRYQAAAMKIDRASREIRWIFGEPSGWGDLSDKVLQPDGEFDWPYHQHSPNPTPNGTLLIYNNGNYEARPFNPPSPVTETYSRAVEYEIDEENMRVRQLWQSEQAGPDSVVSIAMGDVDWLSETENILVAYGAILDPETLDQVDWRADSRLLFNQWTRLREYVRSDPPEVVYEVVLDTGTDDMGWTLFGAERIDHVGP